MKPIHRDNIINRSQEGIENELIERINKIIIANKNKIYYDGKYILSRDKSMNLLWSYDNDLIEKVLYKFYENGIAVYFDLVKDNFNLIIDLNLDNLFVNTYSVDLENNTGKIFNELQFRQFDYYEGSVKDWIERTMHSPYIFDENAYQIYNLTEDGFKLKLLEDDPDMDIQSKFESAYKKMTGKNFNKKKGFWDKIFNQ